MASLFLTTVGLLGAASASAADGDGTQQHLVGKATAAAAPAPRTLTADAGAGADLGRSRRAVVAPLRVVVAGTVPFVNASADAAPEGFSVAMVTEAAELMDRQLHFSSSSRVDEALQVVVRGEADVAVGPISITAERAKVVRFTQPYFQSSLAILAPASTNLLAPLEPFLTRTFIAGASALLLVLIGVGTLLWLSERKLNSEQFPKHPARGIGNGVWMALVTMTTVGYGDRVPKSPAGRVVAGVWMLVSMIVASSLTAFMATALTLSQLGGPTLAHAADLKGKSVAVVQGTTSEAFVRSHGGRVLRASSLEDAVAMLRDQRAAAMVADRPILRYWLHQHPESPFQLSETTYEPQGYGFAVAPTAAELQSELDVALLRLGADGRTAELAREWLGPL